MSGTFVAPLHQTDPNLPMLPNPAPLPVVCAVIVNEKGRTLLAQRPAQKHLGLKWEFPGGKVEPGESPEAAIVREVREELGCAIVIVRVLPRFKHDYGSLLIEMIPFVCALAPASTLPHPYEHTAIAWATTEELSAYDLAPADLPVVAALR
ncbi:MAG: (deoxy)nucleoside triphosphate pyrophosphohydrolase [Opitutaceae bacterium]